MRLTAHPIRLREHPIYSRNITRDIHGTRVFRVGPDIKAVKKFKYLPHVSPQHQLGHPIALGDDIVVSLDFNPSGALTQLINRHFGNNLRRLNWKARRRRTLSNVNQVKLDLAPAARNYFRRIVADMDQHIDEIVPKCTGRLRRSMKSSLQHSIRRIRNMTAPYILVLSTVQKGTSGVEMPVYYANPVNEMPTDWLAHPPNFPLTRKIAGRTYHLYDPGAESGWYEKVLEQGRNTARRLRGMLYHEIVAIYGVNPISIAIYNEVIRSLRFQ